MTPIDQTLRRLVHRTALIVQAEACVFMLHHAETDELVGYPPAFGLEEEQVRGLRIPATEGLSAQVFREKRPILVEDAENDPRALNEKALFASLRNALSVPIIIEDKDEQQRLVGRRVIGVLHVLNKRKGLTFSDDDIRLLAIMAKSAAAVLRNALGDL